MHPEVQSLPEWSREALLESEATENRSPPASFRRCRGGGGGGYGGVVWSSPVSRLISILISMSVPLSMSTSVSVSVSSYIYCICTFFVNMYTVYATKAWALSCFEAAAFSEEGVELSQAVPAWKENCREHSLELAPCAPAWCVKLQGCACCIRFSLDGLPDPPVACFKRPLWPGMSWSFQGRAHLHSTRRVSRWRGRRRRRPCGIHGEFLPCWHRSHGTAGHRITSARSCDVAGRGW